jgi:hypothetical protein
VQGERMNPIFHDGVDVGHPPFDQFSHFYAGLAKIEIEQQPFLHTRHDLSKNQNGRKTNGRADE